MDVIDLIITIGVALWIGLVVQALIGMRVIRLGKAHWKIHRWFAWVLIAVGLVHGGLAFSIFVFGWI